MKKFLSKYSPKYPRSLVYMLQASEYSIGEFFDWLKRVKDFREVEQRKKLVKTFKAQLLLGALAFFIGLTLAIVLVKGDILTLIIYIILLPHLLPYWLALCAFKLSIIQKPIERRIISKARQKLQKHKALKVGIDDLIK